MKIVTLVENSPGDTKGTTAEFGLSVYIEASGKRILLDTGASSRFAKNADALGIDLAKVDLLVLSHGHYDHGGGLAEFFRRNTGAKVVMRPAAGEKHIGTLLPWLPGGLKSLGVLSRDIGIDPALLEANASRISWLSSDSHEAGVHLLSDIPADWPLARGNRFLFAEKHGGSLTPDDFKHELILAIDDPDGCVLFSGCAHNGVLNMLGAVEKMPDAKPVKGIVGGFHLNLPRSEKSSEPVETLDAIAHELKARVDGPIWSGHCTGAEAFAVMKSVLGEQLNALHTGAAFEI